MIHECKKDEQRLYSDLAWTWPIISPTEDYVEMAGYIANTVRKHADIQVDSLLNLGCGGGHEDFSLKRDFHVTGVDLSEDMLALARQLNPECEYVRGDLRYIKLEKTFDAVCATSLIYMKNMEELRGAFETCFAHLNPGGVFVALAEKTRENFKGSETYCTTRSKGGVEITLVESYFTPDPGGTIFEGTLIFLIRREGKLEIHVDSHIGGIFSLDRWLGLLRDVGFDVEVENVEFSEATTRKKFPMLICKKPLE
ncbi:MAG: class I SAM-dependent methyltransferase [Thermoplasmata archaeon]|nr:MAG: class I SAM-dependent methyltransferase [Thermoplasmata archaeon]